MDYYVEFEESEKASVEAALNDLNAPFVLLPLEPTSCLGVTCESSNQCMMGYCSNRQCIYQNVTEGTPCGNGMACSNGTCAKFLQTTLWIKTALLMIIAAAVSAFLVSIIELKKKKHKKTLR